jgi:hypothetical protein
MTRLFSAHLCGWGKVKSGYESFLRMYAIDEGLNAQCTLLGSMMGVAYRIVAPCTRTGLLSNGVATMSFSSYAASFCSACVL